MNVFLHIFDAETSFRPLDLEHSRSRSADLEARKEALSPERLALVVV